MIGHFERITESILLPPWLKREHEGRYEFCRRYVEGRTVLDCGSGEGKGSKSIIVGRPRRMIALDQAPEIVALARSEGIEALAGSAQQLPIRPGTVNAVVALEVIEHFVDPDAFLQEVATLLPPDGLMICSTPNRSVRNPRLPLDRRPLNPWHIREWTPDEFAALLGRHFGTVEIFAHVPQSRRTTAFFDLFGRLWLRGAAILRQLAKFLTIVWTPAGLYDVQAFRKDVDFEFVVCVCSAPRRSVIESSRSHPG